MQKKLTEYTNKEIFLMLSERKFSPFTHHDYQSFSGVTSEEPLISDGEDVTVIIDGDDLVLVDNHELDEISFSLTSMYRM